jgi:hypothetical protein
MERKLILRVINRPPHNGRILGVDISDKIRCGIANKSINSETDKTDTSASTFVYLLLMALHVSIPFLVHPQAYINGDISY